jgi:hypothetical protein
MAMFTPAQKPRGFASRIFNAMGDSRSASATVNNHAEAVF